MNQGGHAGRIPFLWVGFSCPCPNRAAGASPTASPVFVFLAEKLKGEIGILATEEVWEKLLWDLTRICIARSFKNQATLTVVEEA